MSKKVLDVEIIRHKEIAPTIYSMTLQSEEIAKEAKCGQFVNLYPRDKSTLLPRPISISEIGESTITLVYGVVGEGTKEFASYKEGETIRISTAVGTGFKPQETKCGVLVGGGIGVPPLVELAKQIKGPKIVVLGFRDEPFLVREFEEAGAKVYIATDSGKVGFKGNVLELIEAEAIEGDYFYSCGPKIMLKNLADYCAKKDLPVQVSLEERMGCGYGACVGCVCKIKEDNPIGYDRKKVCKDGPVFLGSEVVWND